MKKNLLKIFMVCFTLMITSYINAQNNDIWGDADPGTGGLVIGSKTDNTYSALVINGANSPYDDTGKRDIVYKFRSAGQSIIRAYRGGDWDCYLQFLTTHHDSPYPAVRMHINHDGNVGIGTTNPQNKLDVNGTIRAKEIKVESGWADFVFDEDYNLPSLEEVSSHIKENKHLPGIPSATEVAKDGVNLGEMNVKLLQKIEELTLYVIKQQNILKEQIEKTESQQREIDELKQKLIN